MEAVVIGMYSEVKPITVSRRETGRPKARELRGQVFSTVLIKDEAEEEGGGWWFPRWLSLRLAGYVSASGR